jgi:hypothetical protein
MNLTVLIESAELRFKQVLEDFFISVYDEKYLYSHGIDHHRRVWKYAKELLLIPEKKFYSDLSVIPSKLIITCYLHDIGMSVDPGVRHGKHSRELCILFLSKNNLAPDDYKDVLETIENHDRKDYPENPVINDLLILLSAADDLDAFGLTGIYRYSEIYLLRGIAPAQTGNLILENAKKRFCNFADNFGPETGYVQRHRTKYEILRSFFTHFNQQAVSYNFEESKPSGYCGVIQLFIHMIRNKMSLKEICEDAWRYEHDTIIRSFFMGLESELGFQN